MATRSGLMPLVVGVTGHQDLRHTSEDQAAIAASLRRLFHHLTTWHHWPRDRTVTPLWVLTPLQGATDRVVARVAIEFGAQLIVTLPCAREIYERDLAPTESETGNGAISLAEFREFVEGPHTLRVIEMPTIDPSHLQGVGARDSAGREAQQALMGAYIAKQAEIFVALWDGQGPDSGVWGGAAALVALRLAGTFGGVPSALTNALASVPAPFAVISDGPLGAVHHIVAPRANAAAAPTLPLYSERLLLPGGHDPSAATRRAYLKAMDHRERETHLYNHAVDSLPPRGRVSEDAHGAVLPKTHDVNEPMLLDAIVAADRVIAVREHWTRGVVTGAVAIGILIIVALALYTEWSQSGWGGIDGKQWAAAVVLVLAIIEASYSWAHARTMRARTRAYRVLADGLRAQLYWRAAGWQNVVADEYPRAPNLAWVRRAIRSWGLV